jgi:hypothetical protein
MERGTSNCSKLASKSAVTYRHMPLVSQKQCRSARSKLTMQHTVHKILSKVAYGLLVIGAGTKANQRKRLAVLPVANLLQRPPAIRRLRQRVSYLGINALSSDARSVGVGGCQAISASSATQCVNLRFFVRR